MNGSFEHLIAPVYRHEGTLARLMGGADIIQSIEPYRNAGVPASDSGA